MHLSILLLSSLLLSLTSASLPPKASLIPESAYAGFKHLNARAFAKELETGFHGKKYAPHAMMITLCRFAYCHGEDRADCTSLCTSTGPKFDFPLIGKRIEQLDKRRQPDANQAVCEKECKIECGKSNCNKECPKLCGFHWSYKNRKEYEAEFYTFLIRINNVKGY